ncbi:putative integral membrane protein [Parafrankia sp. EAN1pec]|uniref:DUF4129 domain-containing protein n=1 Tax=Parafrankia sp. (strain EAN1pec) TaxID=298653 RepID=UPI00005421A8|nr:putative integral membrane protein [Frankia sp. EAN1pec]
MITGHLSAPFLPSFLPSVVAPAVAPAAAGGPLGGPVTREGAQDEARRELSKSVYQDAQPDWFTRAITWINDRLADLWNWLTPDTGAGVGGFNGLGVLAVVLVLVALAVVIRLWLGPVRRTARDQAEETDLSSPLTADQLRVLARDQAGQGAYAEAVRSRLRAIVRMLEERGVLDPRPGRTAGELVDAVRAAIDRDSDAIGALVAAVEVFSEIWYGGGPATEQAYEVLVRADEQLTGVRGRPGHGRSDGRSDDGSRPVPA